MLLYKIYREKTTVNHVSTDPQKEAKRLECSLSAYDAVRPTIQFVEPVRKQKRTSSTSFKSVCAHHTFPFFGMIEISYNGFQIKPDSLRELIDFHAKRFQTQEDLTLALYQLLNNIEGDEAIDNLNIRILSEHTCMTQRGVKAHGALTETILPYL